MRFVQMAVVVDQHHGIKPLTRSQRCRLQSYTHLDYSIFPHSFINTCGVANIHKSFSTPCLSQTTALEDDFDSNPRIEIVGGCRVPRVHALVVEVAIAMASGADLLPVPSGLGGAYFLCSRNGDNIAVAKPIDEEPLAFNNPKGFGGRMLGQPGVKRSVRIGESGIRELAAYLLDHGGFASVPPTALVKISHVAFRVNNNAAKISATPYKIASLQRFVDHDFDAGELGFSGFSIASVHHIGIFDVRVLNLDRHAGNMLVKKYKQNKYAVGAAELVPIDHGLCLPEWLDDPYFEWLHWPQASIPFSESEIEYISNLNPSKDAELLRTQIPSLREAAIRVLVLCTIFLKRATAAGLCLADIGEMMTRQFCAGEERLSTLENLCLQVKATMSGTDDKNRETIGEGEIFQLQNDIKESFDENFDLPQLLQIYPGMSRFSSVGSITELTDAYIYPPFKESNHGNDDSDSKNMKGNSGYVDGSTSGSHKVGGLTERVSFSVNNFNCETGAISFGDMSKDEWDLFLDNFEKLLPDILLKGTNYLSLKKRLRTSCKY
ncbi:putative 1-phosphatidylinositol 4-kinase [Rosa chinensis]|uniref:1-phosphatidylinositol 4-kinase n=1 Tax=Rosa chinensis TaxID=74649 RepID=A0A2P6RH29_ROSCH|nr:phosphatidylinositol 4-kinase gamma 8 isoform X1 [Rosa chinensis]PRQ45729.1 putative 1-phosphatidylinositol 4-kinase [Rosa chinensis]